MAYVTSSGQVAEMVKCSRPSQTESIFVTTDAFAEKVYVENLSAKRNVTAKSYPCVFYLTFFCFSESFWFLASAFLASKFATDLPR